MTAARILVVDDEPAIVSAIRTNLEGHGFSVDAAADGREALDRFERHRPDLVLLDLNLPLVDGMDVIRSIRREARTPIVVLSVRGAERDKVAALDLGADDYLTKPFGVDELLARVRVALRHAAASPPAAGGSVFATGDLRVDLDRRLVTLQARPVHLTPTEYELLRALVSRSDRVVTDRMLLQQVWGPEYGDESHYLHVYVARLRRKIERDPQSPRYLLTEPGVGYRLVGEGSTPTR
ncbi:MAG TPA: response regulator transcription factor [Candidatus Limnocylindria bacterium]|nr:response regulator transcription factor [Candidatus Limnocylindria bacterium]